MSSRPNILFIMTDEQKYDTFSCINDKMKTPYLDKLIEESVFFTLSFPGPHQPFDGAGTGYESLYSLEDMERNETVYSDLDQKPPHYKKLNPKAYIDQYPEEKFLETKRSYYATMSLIDDKVGGIVKTLKETGEFDNT